MGDENLDATEIVGAAVSYEADEGDEGVLENPVAPKKLIVQQEQLEIINMFLD